MGNSFEEAFDTSSWDPVDPGWGFDGLADIDPAELGAGGTLTALQAVAQAESILRAKRLELMRSYEQSKHGTPDFEWVADRLAPILNITIARATGELAMAGGLAALPHTFAALAAGRLDQHRARQIVDATQTSPVISDRRWSNGSTPTLYARRPASWRTCCATRPARWTSCAPMCSGTWCWASSTPAAS